MAVQTVSRTDGDARAPEPTAPLPVQIETARPPYGVIAQARALLGLLLGAMCLLTAGGALLFLTAWRQDSTSGLLPNQTDRLWDVWDALAIAERWAALGAAPIAVVWVAVATVNVRRATGHRPNPAVSVVGFGVGIVGAWLAARELVVPGLADDDWVGMGAGIALQAVCLALPLFVLERLADAAAARRRPGRLACVLAFAFVVVVEVSGGLATTDRTTELGGWGRQGALVLIAALIEIFAVLAFTEAGRALEEGTQHRYELRHRFGQSGLTQIGV